MLERRESARGSRWGHLQLAVLCGEGGGYEGTAGVGVVEIVVSRVVGRNRYPCTAVRARRG